MLGKTPKKLSSVLGIYFTISVIILTGAVLFFTYRLSIQTINTEIGKYFLQQQNIAENIFDWESERLENSLQDVQNNDKILKQLSIGKNLAAQTIFQQFIDKSARYNVDVLFISTTDNPVWVNASSPVPDSNPIFVDLVKKKRALLLSAKIFRFKSKTTDLTGIFKSKKIILEDGQVMGVLIAGTILNNNLHFLNRIKHKTKSLAVALIQNSTILASSEREGLITKKSFLAGGLHENEDFQMAYRQDTSSGQLISNSYAITLYGTKTPVRIVFSTDDTVLKTVKQTYLNTLVFISILLIISDFGEGF